MGWADRQAQMRHLYKNENAEMPINHAGDGMISPLSTPALFAAGRAPCKSLGDQHIAD